jgi:outer membrane biosynthesis protein TonB
MKKTIAVCGTALLSAALFAAPGGRPGAPAPRQEVRVVKPAPRPVVKPLPPPKPHHAPPPPPRPWWKFW